MFTQSRPLAFLLTLAFLVMIIPAEISLASDSIDGVADSAVVTSPDGSVVAIHGEPSITSPVLFEAHAGSSVTVHARDLVADSEGALWSQVSIAGFVGFIPSTSLSPLLPEPTLTPEPPAPASPPIIKTVYGLDGTPTPCFDIPSLQGALLLTVPPGASVELDGEIAGDWQPVRCNGLPGFILASAFVAPVFVTTPEAEATVAPTPPQETPIPESTETVVVEVELTQTVIVDLEPTEIQVEITETPLVELTPIVAIADDETVVDVASFGTVDSAQANTARVFGTGGAGVRCRASAGYDGQILTVLAEGSQVSLNGSWTGAWQPVTCGNQTGFVWSQYLDLIQAEGAAGTSTPTSSTTASIGTVQNTGGFGLRCRATGDYAGAIITVIPEGSSLPLRGPAENGWQPVVCADRDGYVFAEFFGASVSGSTPPPAAGGTGSSGVQMTVANTEGLGVRFRAGATMTSAVIAVLPEGTLVVTTSGSEGVWTAITFGNQSGFVHSDYLGVASGGGSSTVPTPVPTPDPPAVGSSELAAGSHALVEGSLRLRSGPSFSSTIASVAPEGTVVRITGAKENGFYPVTWDTLSGYMHADYLTWTDRPLTVTITPPTTTVPGTGGGAPTVPGSAGIVSYAMQYVGYPYVWATHGPNSFDCSGFTSWVVLNVLGKQIWYSVTSQWGYGTPVAREALQPGDLVFFQNTYTFGLSHVGIYIGNDQFVHASNETTGVIVSSLNSNYYATRWFGARRMA